MKVKAAVARSRGEALRLEGLALAEPGPDEILVRIVACGVAQADLDAIDGALTMPLPFVPGTEGAGIIERIGADVVNLHPGDSVIVGFDTCGRCESCTAGRPRHCLEFVKRNLAGRRFGGPAPFDDGANAVNGRFFGQSSFATHAVCRASQAIKLASGSPLEVLACLGGEFLLGAGVVLRAFDMQANDSLVVVGAGATGLAATMLAKARGAGIIVVAESDERRRMLASELGASAAVHTDENLDELVRSLTAEGARFALDTTGEPWASEACRASLMRGGTCALAGPTADIDCSERYGDDAPGMILADAYAAPAALIPELVSLHARGDLPLEQLVDFFPFEHVNDALDSLRDGAGAKPVLRFSIGSFGDLDRALAEGARHEAPSDAPADADRPLVRS